MMRLVWIVALLAAGSAAIAEQVRFRSGEHPGFTRLVIEFDARPAWRAGRTATGYGFVFEGDAPLDADASQAFRIIGRQRLAEIGVDAGARRIDVLLACDCAAEIFELGASAIVIDLRDGAPGDQARFEAPLDERSESVPPALTMLSPGMPAPAPEFGPAAVAPRLTPVRTVTRPAPAAPGPPSPDADRAYRRIDGPVQPGIPGLAGTSRAADAFLSAAESDAISGAAVSALSEQLARAVAQGLLEPADRIAPAEGGPRASAQEVPGNFRVMTGFDRDVEKGSGQITSPPLGGRCLSGTMVKLSDWGDPSDPSTLGRLRRDAIAEDGTLTDGGARDLARFYIVLGFGSEAAALARRLPDGPEREILLGMADIIDSGASASPVFDGQLQCESEVSLWAALARPFGRSETPQAVGAILAEFSGLPHHLRVHLGPLLSERLRAVGETDAARVALNAVTRAGTGSSQQDLTAARLGLTGTNAEQAREELERLSRGTDFTAAEALLELLQDAERRDVPPKPAWIDDAPSLVRATKGTDVAAALSVASLRGHIPLGRFDALRRALTVTQPGVDDAVRRDIAAAAISAAVRDAGDEEFLRSEVGFSAYAPPDALGRDAATDVAERLVGLGLPQKALAYLAFDPVDPDERALAARTLSELRELDRALALLEGQDAPELNGVRGTVLARKGQLMAAAEAFVAAENPRLASRKALQSGDWAWLSEQGAEGLDTVVGALVAPSPKSPEAEEDDGNAVLLSEVGARRDAIDRLLGNPLLNPSR